MQAPDIPADDAARVDALRALDVLDSRPEERFDRITRIACAMFGVPTALVSLVDQDRQWFKSRQGLDAVETPRDVSFCGHAILGERVMVVENALEDLRFCDNPLVTGPPDIRFYAGAPLSSVEGHKLGTLCLLSPEPRTFSASDRRLLEDLGAIVEQELMSAELARARDAALAADRAKNQFLANMNHEMRTPLNAVIGLSETLLDTDLAPAQRDQAEAIHTNGRALAGLFTNIVSLSSLEQGDLRLADEVFEVLPLIEELDGLARSLAADRSIAVSSEHASALPARVRGDRERLRQALSHLVSNAVKFTEAGSVTLSAGAVAGELEYQIRDTGIGMSPDTLDRAFRGFFQADSSDTRRYQGMGIGLSVARSIIELMQGSVAVESELGHGTVVTVRIPISEVQGVPTEPASDAETLRALVVDDNPVNLKILSLQLGKLGHEAQTAASGQEALDLANQQAFDVILMDIQMPEMTGTEAMQTLRKTDAWRDAPIIAVTASATDDERADFIAAGFTDLATKPVRNELLAAKLAGVVRRT